MLQRSARTCHRLPAFWLEALVLAVGYTLYQFVQILVVGSRRSAVDRATWLWSTEQLLHVDPEVWLNHFVAQHYGLVVVTGLYYGILHFAVTPLVLVWLRSRRPDSYAPVRNTLVGASVAALFAYWLIPLAPPRLSVPAVIDTMKLNEILSAGSPSGLAALSNQYAAMPSLHVAWAVWVALAVAVAFPTSQARHLAWAYPVSTTVIVMATGHHFLADAVAAALLVWVAWAVSRALGARVPGGRLAYPDPAAASAD
ncbi:MAG TPA: phosphatase PAP2 family protein [Dermatophilaceae bacterium]|nr:phosphatase PAP2 family protein [Dermatophilaceae bacterium]